MINNKYICMYQEEKRQTKSWYWCCYPQYTLHWVSLLETPTTGNARCRMVKLLVLHSYIVFCSLDFFPKIVSLFLDIWITVKKSSLWKNWAECIKNSHKMISFMLIIQDIETVLLYIYKFSVGKFWVEV